MVNDRKITDKKSVRTNSKSKFVRIGLMLSMESGFFRGVMLGVRKYAISRPNWIILPAPPETRRVTEIQTMDVKGVIAAITSTQLAIKFTDLKLPVVDVAADVPGLLLPQVSVDSQEAGRVAARHFLDCGLMHFGFYGPPRLEYSIQREAGFRKTIEAAGHVLHAYHESSWSVCAPSGPLWHFSDGLSRWLVSLSKPVGVFVPDDSLGLRLTEACRQTGLRVPEDVAILGVDNDDLICELARPQLSSIALPAERVGYEAAAILDDMIARKRRLARQKVLTPIGVVPRQSTDIVAVADADVAEAVRFIRDRCHTPLYVDQVVNHVAIGRRTLERRFQAMLGRGIWEEIRRVQIQCAKALLVDTAFAIAKVSELSGFTDQHLFSAVFRQKVGLAPSAYRRQLQAR